MKFIQWIKSLFKRPKVEHENKMGTDTIAAPKKEEVPYIPAKQVPRYQYEIYNHMIKGVRYEPDHDIGGEMTPKGIVLHYTMGYGMNGTIHWFKTNAVDIHLIVDRDGTIVQMSPFNRKCAHAGQSSWRGYTSLNNHFIGIEFCNIGKLTRRPDGLYDGYGRKWNGQAVFRRGEWFEPLTDIQEKVCVDLCSILKKRYNFSANMICGHDEASPGRKSDLGGTLSISMEELRGRIAVDSLYN
jgi:N-acetylmuramoyl-L-alanine amidase